MDTCIWDIFFLVEMVFIAPLPKSTYSPAENGQESLEISFPKHYYNPFHSPARIGKVPIQIIPNISFLFFFFLSKLNLMITVMAVRQGINQDRNYYL